MEKAVERPLDRLARLVRTAEAKQKSGRISKETEAAVVRTKTALNRYQEARKNYDQVAPLARAKLEASDSAEKDLKELTKKMAKYRSTMTEDEVALANEEISLSQSEIDKNRTEARETFDRLSKELADAKTEQAAASQEYERLRAEAIRLETVMDVEGVSEVDQLIQEVKNQSPKGMLQNLIAEVRNPARYESLNNAARYAQMKVWIGTQRYLKEELFPSLPEISLEDRQQVDQIFYEIRDLSQYYQPGYIEAFKIDVKANWEAYVRDSKEELRRALEVSNPTR